MIQLAARSSVQPVRDEWARARDERPAVATSGGNWWTGGADGRASVRAVYCIVIGLVAAASVMLLRSGVMHPVAAGAAFVALEYPGPRRRKSKRLRRV